MADRLVVDLDGLGGFASDLAALRGRLREASVVTAPPDDALGSEALRGALEEFTGHWRDNRERIDHNLGRLAALAGAAVEALRRVDGDLAKGIDHGR